MSLAVMDMGDKLETLQTITKGFSEELMVGRGAYGNVYRATYNGKEIAVKKFHQYLGGQVDDKGFDNEVLNLRGIQHQNIVRLLGYCFVAQHTYVEHNGGTFRAEFVERLLCFEYMQGGNLETHISDESCDLDWPTCYKIIRGVCDGLYHLHTAKGKPIYHLDLKPANILLDENMTPKIGDLGLSKLVVSTQTHRTLVQRGTEGYMPPEYRTNGVVSDKFDVFSLGVIILKLMAGNASYASHEDMPPEQFIEFVTEKWKEKPQGTRKSSSQETDTLRLKTCVDIALRCVKVERKERPHIKDIVNKLEELEAEIIRMSLSSDRSKDLIGLQRSSADSNILSVDPTLELRFLFEPRKDISCCLQLTNLTEGSIAFNIKTNTTKYYTEPKIGIIPPCSKRYVMVTLRAQEEEEVQCRDMLHVQSVKLTSDAEITGDLFEKVMMDRVVDVVKLPIVYVARDQFTH